MKRRKKYYTEVFEKLEDAFEYIKRIKDLNGRQVEVEMTENSCFNCFVVEVWKVR